MKKRFADTGNNVYRFIPGAQKPKDGELLRRGARYSREAIKTDTGFVAGIAVGPEVRGVPAVGDGFVLSPGGVIVPARPNEKLETLRVREFSVRDAKDKGKVVGKKKYIDFATFKQVGKEIFAMPYQGEQELYVEIWTGDTAEAEENYQLIQAGYFGHGSVAFSGGSVIIDAGAKKKAKKSAKTPATPDGAVEEGVRSSQAELVGERHGTVVAGIPLWTARLWRLRYSEKDSEAILVRQLGTFYLLLAEQGKLTYREVSASAFSNRFERLSIEQFAPKVAA